MKRFIQLFSFLALIFAATAANAQTEYASEVEFPFAFTVGDRDYSAGKYGIKVNRNQSGTATILIEDLSRERLQIVLATRNGDAPTTDVSVVFEKYGDKRVLTRVVTPDGGFVIGGNPSQRVAGADLKHLYKPGVVHVSDLD